MSSKIKQYQNKTGLLVFVLLLGVVILKIICAFSFVDLFYLGVLVIYMIKYCKLKSCDNESL